MTDRLDQSSDSDARLNEVLAAYLEAAESSKPIDREQLVANHPNLADELLSFFANRDRLDRLAADELCETQAHDVASSADDHVEVTVAGEPTSDPLKIGETVRYFGDYELLEELARGGMGVVYKARQVSLNRMVALKVILTGQFASPVDVQRFRAEAEAAGNLDHSNIVPIFEIGDHNGQQYFSMKLFEGGNLGDRVVELRELIQQGQQRAAEVQSRQKELVQTLATVARAVHHAHQRGTLHRDLKPANVLIDSDGQPHVADFGLAKRMGTDDSLTQSGAVLGTPAYMSPEQAAGKKGAVTTLTDVYSLGAMLYEVLAGRVPFRGDSVVETLKLVREQDPEPPSRVHPACDRDLEAVCLKCLSKDPRQRYSTAEALADDLDNWLAGEPLSVRPPTMAYQMVLWLRRNVKTTLWIMLIGLVCGCLFSLAVSATAVAALFDRTLETYAQFPSLQPPRTLAFGSTIFGTLRRPVLLLPLAGLGIVAFFGMGLFAVLVARPKDAAGDMIAGLSTGLVAGLTAFAIAVGPAITLALIVVPSIVDFMTIEKVINFDVQEPDVARVASSGAQPRGNRNESQSSREGFSHRTDVLVEQYPDLKEAPIDKRAGMFYTKMIADQVAGAFLSTWLGIASTLGSCVVLAVVEAVVAGAVFRRYTSLRSVLGRYSLGLLTVCLFTWLFTWSCIFVLEPDLVVVGVTTTGSFSPVGLLFPVKLILIIGGIGLFRERPWQLIASFFAAWIVCLGRIAELGPWGKDDPITGGPYPLSIAEAIAFGCVVLLLAYYSGRRPGRASEDMAAVG